MGVNLKSLIARLNPTCHSALEGAAGLCLSRTNYDVEPEHLLLKLIERADTDLAAIFRRFEINQSRITRDLTTALDRLKTGNARTPGLSPRLPQWIQEGWLLASIDFGAAQIRSGHLLLALLANDELGRLARDISRQFAAVSVESLKRDFAEITANSMEAREATTLSDQPAAAGADGSQPAAGGKTKALDQFTIDLTARARAGQIDPVLGRDFEIRQVIDILTRRRQNNPILTGEAGVGKTAVVEGFALRVAAGDVPEPLKKVAVRTLDLGLLQAGAGIKGEFENRLKSVIEEVKASPQPIILFIDEAHTMIGAGGQAGQSDAANLLKPALARGELRTIAATTWAEYKKYFEKDAALSRRCQVVKVEEPTEEQAIVMMRGLTETLENHHKVRILDEAVEDAVRLSHRYISGRQLPDKSVSVLDTACARVAIGLSATPPAIEDAGRRLDQLRTQIDALEREAITGTDHAQRIAELTEFKSGQEQALAGLKRKWDQEREIVGQIRDIRARLEQHAARSAPNPGEQTAATSPAVRTGRTATAATPAPQSTAAAAASRTAAIPASAGKPASKDATPTPPPAIELDAMRAELAALNEKLEEPQGETPLLQACVTSQTVAEVISGWTGIPVGRMLADEINTVLTLAERLGGRVVGQADALEAISRRIRTSRANLTDPRRPVGVFLL